MRNRRNYYRILHVQPDAPLEIIRSSYRTLMQRLKQHPDLGGDHWNAALINEAYATLTDSANRAEYDRQLLDRGSGGATVGRTPDAPGEAASASQARGSAGASGTDYAPTVRNYCSFCKTPHAYGEAIPPDAECADCRSPLYPAVKQRLEALDQRAVARIAKRHAVTFYTGWPQAIGHVGQSRDMSLDGMKFLTPHAVIAGQFLKIDSPVCRAVVRVANCRSQRSGGETQWLGGVEFISLRFTQSRGAFVSAEA